MSLSMSVGRTERELFDRVEDTSVVALSSTGSRARLMRILRRRCWAAAASTRAQVMSDGARSMPPMRPDTHWAMLGRGAALQAQAEQILARDSIQLQLETDLTAASLLWCLHGSERICQAGQGWPLMGICSTTRSQQQLFEDSSPVSSRQQVIADSL